MKTDDFSGSRKRSRPTVGQYVYKNLSEKPEFYDPQEIQRAMQGSTCVHLEECIQRGSKVFDHFYVVYLLRYEILAPGALRGRFWYRQTRPDPDWDTSLWEYNKADNKLLFHWSLPDKETGLMMLSNPSGVPDHAKELLGFVQKFHKGELR